jgi:hypothetical protein
VNAVLFVQGGGLWRVNASPTMRSLGEVTRGPDKTFTVASDAEAYALDGIHPGPYASLDDAMAAIAAHLGGSCRIAPSRTFR